MLNLFEQYLEKTLPNPDSIITKASNYALLNPGKRVRSTLLFKFLESFEINKPYYELGACIEMIHTYSLIHDDLPAMDNDDIRRGKPTVHLVYGEANAILAGDNLLTMSFNEIVKVDLDSNKKIKILDHVIQAAGIQGMIYGQELDLKAPTDGNIDVAKIHHYKTAKMLCLPIKIGCVLTNLSFDLFEEAMNCFGLAFQILDDILDVESTTNNLGKSIGKDEQQEKLTYVKKYGLIRSKELYEENIQKCLNILKDIPFKNNAFIEYIQFISNREW